MLFTQFEFMFLFLPVVLVGYFAVGAVAASSVPRLVWLTAASLFFYGYWDVRFLPVIAISVAVNYVFGILINGAPQDTSRRRAVFIAAVAANLAAIAYFKYTNFGLQLFGILFHQEPAALDITLPLGISFFTFTQIAYLADVYGGYRSERNFAKYALFVTYFPHLVAGPILHHKEMMPQFGAEDSRRPSARNLSLGLTVFAIGLFKKAVIADSFATIVNPIFDAAAEGWVPAFEAWGGALAYSLQIYFDFSGYSDMAIGLSLLFGIVLPFNFDSPYKSRSIAEFWRRWHITLSRFLRDYLYIPLGGSRHGNIRRYVNLAVTMLLGGLWHGAALTYVVWGALHGLFLVINHGWTDLRHRHAGLNRFAGTAAFGVFALVLTQFLVVVAWVFFRAPSIGAAQRLLEAMLGIRYPAASSKPLVTWEDFGYIAAGYLVCLASPNVIAIFDQWRIGIEEYRNQRLWSVLDFKWRPTVPWAIAAASVLLVAVVVSLSAGTSSQFIYFQF